MGRSLAAVVMVLALPHAGLRAQEIAYGADVGLAKPARGLRVYLAGCGWNHGRCIGNIEGTRGGFHQAAGFCTAAVLPSSGRKMTARSAYLGYCDTTRTALHGTAGKGCRASALWWIFITVTILPIPNTRMCPRSGRKLPSYSELLAYVYDYTYYIMNQLAQKEHLSGICAGGE